MVLIQRNSTNNSSQIAKSSKEAKNRLMKGQLECKWVTFFSCVLFVCIIFGLLAHMYLHNYARSPS